jgi:predicted nucleic acid-binding protein
MNLVDTSGWIEYFFGRANGSYFAEPIENTAELSIPVVCLYDVFKKVNQVADEARALRAIAQMKQGRGSSSSMRKSPSGLPSYV